MKFLTAQTIRLPDGRNPMPKRTPRQAIDEKAKKRAEREGMKKAASKSTKPKREGISPRLRAMVMERDGYACTLCHTRGSTENPLQIGHLTPVAQGGTNEEENLRVECRDCNLGGGARKRLTPEEKAQAERWRAEKDAELAKKLEPIKKRPKLAP